MEFPQKSFALAIACLLLQFLSSSASKALCELSPGWRLVWADEFEGDTLNTSNWTPQDKASPRNHELEDYDPANVLVRDGNLVLVSKREKRDGMNYTSGSVNSRNKVAFRYGRMCIRAKLPRERMLSGLHIGWVWTTGAVGQITGNWTSWRRWSTVTVYFMEHCTGIQNIQQRTAHTVAKSAACPNIMSPLEIIMSLLWNGALCQLRSTLLASRTDSVCNHAA